MKNTSVVASVESHKYVNHCHNEKEIKAFTILISIQSF